MKSHSHIGQVFLLLLSTALLTACATSGGNDRMHRADTPETRRNAAEVHTQLGHGLMREGRLKQALEKLQIAVQFDPDYAPAHTMLGTLYSRIDNLPEAEKQYRRAVQLKPKEGDTNNNYAVLLCKMGKADKARSYFKKALADPFYKTPAVAWTNAGICRTRAGQYPLAVSDLQKALAIDPTYATALYQMARALYGQGEAFRASAFIQRYMARGHPHAQALKLGYDIATRLGNAEVAQNYARQLRNTFPDSKQAQALNTQTSP